jgi:hypothetical protein
VAAGESEKLQGIDGVIEQLSRPCHSIVTLTKRALLRAYNPAWFALQEISAFE